MKSICRNVLFHIIVLFCLQGMVATTVADTEKPLVMGIFPYVSAGKIIAHNKDLKQYLETKLNRKIIITSARNVREFIQRSANNDYDFVFTAPHHGYYLEKAMGYQRIAMTKNKIQGYYLVKKDSKYHSLEDLRNKKIAMAPAITILHQMAVEQLRELGMLFDDQTEIVQSISHNNAIFLLLNNKSDAAVTGIKIWNKLQGQHKDRLKVLAETPTVPGFLMVANKDLSADVVQQLQQFAIQFDQTPAGQNYLFHGFKVIDDDTVAGLEAYTAVFTNIVNNPGQQ